MRVGPTLSSKFGTLPQASRREDELTRGRTLAWPNTPARNEFWSPKMDIVLSLTGIGFFALMLGYVRTCDRL